jgi:uncharacterized Zn-binding protein involved in type VI secretion
MPQAARVGDMHTCPAKEPGPVPHVGGPVQAPGEPTVLIGGKPAARAGDKARCSGAPAADAVAQGERSVLIGERPAARLGDRTAHGGAISGGCPTVWIGSSPQVQALRAAAALGVPFCERCESLRRRRRRRRGARS